MMHVHFNDVNTVVERFLNYKSILQLLYLAVVVYAPALALRQGLNKKLFFYKLILIFNKKLIFIFNSGFQ